MTYYSPNVRIPHLGQNTAQPEIPENTAKDIIDSLFSETYVLETVDSADIMITHNDSSLGADSWQSFIIEIKDTGGFLTGPINVSLPDNKRPYIFKNSTTQSLTFKTTTGTGFLIQQSKNAYGYSDGVNLERLNFVVDGAGTLIGTMNDVSPGYGTNGQVLVTNGTDFFTYEDIIATFLTLTDVDETTYVGAAGSAIVVNQTETGLEFGVAGISLEGANQITDSPTQYGNLYTGDAAINFTSDATTGTGLMYGTQGLIGINADIEFFNIDPVGNETSLLGANTKVTHADASVTSLNNPEWIAQNAQRTADVALKNTMDINLLLDTLSKAVTLTYNGTTGPFTFNLT